ncbi:SpaH/EbpB family LPXTG-anchored major pilin [Corynebacterium spheniscorum]|uniref:LPXTG-motif cell wall anchor domain-containing protein/fimbrial isopeptide formation D2 domain-containing protein n=1 Tax=Corynebacterium spheniscorum TaxID=185761 RepID=A0A1I2PK96_9CORY|nr:SpaH/EbpB family LPXTG-anchored major pilin [Corynebacterium spheniscorum]KAA8723763.1 SpaH/EbpB family LPXTG-anchored major pilin [Corynebacterium spheniscorum]SFG15843.1 LPXTG-motif cell wall anchor domain-containing protein/fimbrial isopeptide formation D2 domain-containing protein [Corynebacterium spheniscorum]
MTKHRSQPVFAIVGALALALGGVIPATAPNAAAVVVNPAPTSEQPAPPAPELPASLIDPAKTGSLTIHKYLSDKATEVGTGNEQSPIPGQPMDGVSFTVQRVDADLTTDEGWANAVALTPDTANPTGKPEKKTTAGGVATFSELPVGVYLVTEDSPPQGSPGQESLVPSAPFLVFIPMTNPDDTSQWNYDIHVYPKNSKIGITKSVEDAGKHVGDKLTWTITADIPVPTYTRETATTSSGEGEETTTTTDTVDPLTKYVISDPVPSDRVKVSAEDVTVTAPKVEGLAPADYTVTVDPNTSEVTVTFGPSGLQKLAEARHAAAENGEVGEEAPQVIVTIDAEILEVGETSGMTFNEATLNTKTSADPDVEDIEVKSDEVVTQHRTVTIDKHEKGNPDTKLEGAEFELYVCDADAQLGEKIEAGNNPDAPGEKFSSWTTGADGTVTIDGLHVTDFADNAYLEEEDQKYCLVETKAPEGYELRTQPVPFELPSLSEGVEDPHVVSVANIKSVSPNLPLTGGPGIIALVLAGLALIGGGAWYGLRSSRRS